MVNVSQRIILLSERLTLANSVVRIERTERTVEDSERPIVQCHYLVVKDTAASDGLKVLSMSVKSSGYGTSTVVETKGATDTFAVT